MKTVEVMMFDRSSETRYHKQVEGRPVKFKGFEQYQFILHRSPEFTVDWRVSEATTGLWFASEKTPNEALHSAKDKLAHVGIDGVEKAFAKAKLLYNQYQLKERDDVETELEVKE